MRGLTRRGLLAAAAASAAGAVGSAGAEDRTQAETLRGAAAARGIGFGSYLNLVDPREGPEWPALAERQCAIMVGAQMGWDQLAPTPERIDFAYPDRNYAWARAHKMAFRGHTLVWGEHVPGWFERIGERAAAERALQRFITEMCRHFVGRMHSWDVVNEAIMLGAGSDNLRRQAFLDKLGPEYLDLSFRAARAADPAAKLVYNEFGVEFDVPAQNDKRRALLDLLDGLRGRSVPIDAVGIQSHLSTALMPHFNDQLFADFLRDLADRGFEIMLSELDVGDRDAPADIAARDAAIADAYRRYLAVALDNRKVTTVLTWGLDDRTSWMAESDDRKIRRPDGLPPRPLPFDAEYRPKPAYAAMIEAFKAAPPR